MRGWKVAMLGATLLAVTGCTSGTPGADPGSDAPGSDAGSGGRRVVILMIGDGMGPAQLAAASHLAAGEDGALFVQALPNRGQVVTGGPSGITDSAAAATALASGVFVPNGVVGLDRSGAIAPNLVELARDRGLATGLVTTTSLTHATPAAFAAHVPARGQEARIAEQIAALAPEVLLGGGARFFEDRDDGRDLAAELAEGGHDLVRTAAALQAAGGDRVLGLFADNHLPYVLDRAEDSDVPSLAELSRAAIERLDRDPDGFFLVIEGGRIDHASHGNDLARAVHETLDFDAAVREVATWAEGRDEVTLIVTADHETGGLEVLTSRGAGALPEVRWRWGGHTNALVPLAGVGPGAERLAGMLVDHRWVHAALAEQITGAWARPPRALVPSGYVGDLLGPAAEQTRPSDAAPSRLDRLVLDADDRGLFIGLEGAFEWDRRAVVVLLDVDHGAASGVRAFDGSLADHDGAADALLSSLRIAAPADDGWGADFALVSIGGLDPKLGQSWERAGLRDLRSPTELVHLGAAINFADGARTRGDPVPRSKRRGLEASLPWDRLYGAAAPPPGTQIAAIALLVSEDGAVLSNQTLPAVAPSGSGDETPPTALPRPLRFAPRAGEQLAPRHPEDASSRPARSPPG